MRTKDFQIGSSRFPTTPLNDIRQNNYQGDPTESALECLLRTLEQHGRIFTADVIDVDMTSGTSINKK